MSKFNANAMMVAAETKTSEELDELVNEINVLAGNAIMNIGDIVTTIDSDKKATPKKKLTEARRAKEKLIRVVAGLETDSNVRPERERSSRQSAPVPAPVAKPEAKVDDQSSPASNQPAEEPKEPTSADEVKAPVDASKKDESASDKPAEEPKKNVVKTFLNNLKK